MHDLSRIISDHYFDDFRCGGCKAEFDHVDQWAAHVNGLIQEQISTAVATGIDVTAWIRSTMSPDIAAWALVLTPGARWHVAPENLVGRTAEFAALRTLIKKWDTDKFLVEQFEINPEWLAGDATMKDAYEDARSKVTAHEFAIDQKITEFGA